MITIRLFVDWQLAILGCAKLLEMRTMRTASNGSSWEERCFFRSNDFFQKWYKKSFYYIATYYWKKFTLKDEHDGDNNHLSDFSNWLQLLLFIYLTYTNFVRCLFCLFNVSRPCLFFFMCNFGYLKIKDWFSVYSNKYKVCENIFQMKNGD